MWNGSRGFRRSPRSTIVVLVRRSARALETFSAA
jgi:hypothetical protein